MDQRHCSEQSLAVSVMISVGSLITVQVAGTALYTFIPPLQSCISFVFRTREPDQQPIWILRLWLSLCPAVPAIIVGMLVSPRSIRFFLVLIALSVARSRFAFRHVSR